jgi:hypothetical protein
MIKGLNPATSIGRQKMAEILYKLGFVLPVLIFLGHAKLLV